MKKITIILLLIMAFSHNSQAKKENQDQCSKMLMESIATLSGVSLYQIYLNIDIMNNDADMVENLEFFDNLLFILEHQLHDISEHFATYNKCPQLKKEDFEYIFKIKEVIFLLKEDIKLFRTYLENSGDEEFTKFFEHHSKVYKVMNDLFGIEDSLQEQLEEEPIDE